MTNGRPHDDLTETRVRRQSLVAQLSMPARQFLRTEAGSAGLLLAATVPALLWANSPWSESYDALWRPRPASRSPAGTCLDLAHWVNDGLMVVFFFVIGLEVRHEFAVGELPTLGGRHPADRGSRRTRRPRPALPGAQPAGQAARGWGVVIGTDTAFLLGALALVGPTFATQLRIFLLTLTVIDDIVAVSVIGLVYCDSLDPAALAAWRDWAP